MTKLDAVQLAARWNEDPAAVVEGCLSPAELVPFVQAYNRDGISAVGKFSKTHADRFTDVEARAHYFGHLMGFLRIEGEVSDSPEFFEGYAKFVASLSSLSPIRGAQRTPREQWDASAELRAEFGGDFTIFETFVKAEADGRARIIGGQVIHG
jgi:hypothetical protein